MNTKTNTRPTSQAVHADDAGMVAYWAARHAGADADAAMAAYLDVYAQAMRGER